MVLVALGWMVCVATGAETLQPGQTVYALGSGVNLRAGPDPAAAAVVVVPIASPLKVLTVAGDWTQVAFGRRRGWMRSNVLSAEKPTLDNVMARYNAASALEERRVWIERAAALDPTRVDVFQHMISVMTEAKDEAAAAWARQRLEELRLDGPVLEVMGGRVLLEGECTDAAAPLLPPPLQGSLVLITEAGDVKPVALGKAAGCWSDEYSSGHRTVALDPADDTTDGAVLPARLAAGFELVLLTEKDAAAAECFSKRELKDLQPAQEDDPGESASCREYTSADGAVVLQTRAVESEGGDAIVSTAPQWRWRKPLRSNWETRCGNSAPLVALTRDGTTRVVWKGHWLLAGTRPEFITTTTTKGPQKGTTVTGTAWEGLRGVACR